MLQHFHKVVGLILMLALTLAMCACGAAEKQEVSSAAVSSTQVEASVAPEPEPVEPIYVTYPGFVNFTVTEKTTALKLPNDEENTVSFVFTITDRDSGEVLYTSAEVAPGTNDSWDVTTAYQSGTHRVTIVTQAVGEGVGNSSTQHIEVICGD